MRRRIVLSDDEEEEFEEEEEEDGGDVGSSEEEDEEGQDEFEVDGFIVDDVEEGNGGKKEEISKEGHKKKKRRKSENEKYELDEDDYKLLEEHNITSFDRPTSSSKKFKRLKKAGRDPKHGNGRYKSKHGLFGDVKGGAFEDIVEEKQLEDEDEDTSEEDEMADFIVDEEKVDVKGLSVRKKNPNKRNPKHGAGSSSMAWQETHCIFGDVDELLRNQARNGTYDNSGEMTLEEEFEHGILGDQYTREKHEQFRKNDMPERIQLLEERTGPFPKDYESIQMESRWIYNQLVASAISSFFEKEQASNIIKDIGNVLGMLHLQKLDIPFIAMYRKELCVTLLRDPEQDYSEFGDGDKMENTPKLKWHKGLWAIQNLDKKWLLLHARKNALGLYYNKHAEEETRGDPLKKALFDSLLQSLNDATSERDIDDIDLKFDLHFGQFKIPKPKSLYRVCQMSGLGGATSKFVFSPEQFGKLLNLEKMGDRLEEAEETPEDVAARFICPEFVTPQDVLRGACHLAAVDISCDLLVRKHVCTSFMNRGVISTKPTLNGNSAIDSFHQFSGVKWLRDKPISMFNDAQWLLIQKAEEEKLLQVTVRIPDNEKGESWIQEFEEKYLSDGVSKATQLWNEQRRLILKEALSNYLIPFVEKEVRSLLTTRAKSWLIMEYGKKLWDKVSVSPYKLKDKDGGQTEMNSDTSLGDDVAPRVMACCWGPGKPETTFVMLDPSGNVLDVLYTPSLNGRSKSLTQQQRKKIDQKHVLKFMSDHQPHIVVLGAASLACTRLKDDISEIIKVIEECPGEDSQVMGGIRIVYGDESLPFLYENSQISSDQLPGQQGIARRAVALGRFLLNPLAMVATLCGPEREILSLKLHRLEHLLTPDERYEVIEQVMIDATNQVGIDLNLAACHGWLFAPLQFVSGLGPCKASFLQQAIVNSGWIYSRKEIAMNLGVKRNVFINAAGFLRVCPNSKAVSGGQIFDLLDDTRIHPESYVLAHKMVKDVYATEEDTDITEMNREAHEMTIEHVRKNPELLRVFDIEKYAERMESLGTHKLETLYDIKRELLYGFHDWRIPYSEPDPDEVFYMVCGETEETLTEGRIVQAKVIRVQSRVTCVLESGLIGLILKEDFSDDMDFDLCDKVIEGSTLTCKIKDISKDRFLVFLTCKGSELKKTRLPNYQEKDPYYCEDESSLRSSQEKARKEPTTSFKPRMITHPRFQNLTAAEVLEFLSDKEPGESIIRPSSKGPSYLTLTLKVYDGVYAHKEIAEGGKDYTDMNSLLCLGKFLKIGDDIFANLDEVIDHYVDPLVTNLKKMLSYRKFKKGSLTEVDDLLRAEKAEHPMRIVYCFGVSHEHPGAFVLSYIRSASPRHEYISLYPKGFQFRKEMFDGLERLVVYFQKNINNMQHNAMPSTSWNDSAANVSDGGCADKNDYRSSGGWGEHPSGLPRPPGRGRGRGRRGGRGGSGGEGHDSAFGSKWGQDSGSKDDNGGWGSFTDNKVQNSPADDSNGGGNGSGSGGGRWGGGGGRNSDGGSWGGGAGGGSSSDAGGGSWGDGGNGASWGGDGGNGGRGSSWGGGGGIDNGGDSWGVGGSSSGGSGRWGGGDGGDDAGGHSWGRGGGEGGNRGRGRGRRGRGGADDGGYRGNDNSWGGGGGNDDADGGSWVGGGGEGGHRGRGRGRQGRGGRWGGDGGNDNAGGGSWVDSGGEGGYRGRGRGRRGRGGSWGGGGDDGGNSWGGGGNDDINGSSWGGGGGRWADGEGSKSSRGGRWRGGGDGGGNRSNDTGRGGGDGNKSGRGGSWGGGSGSGSSWGGGGGSGSSWGGGDGGGRSWGGGGGSGNDTGLGGDCGSRKNSGGSWGGDGGGDGSKSFRSGSWGGGDGSKSDIGSKWGGVDVGGGSWGGDDTKKSGGGSSWGGDDAKKSGGGSSWGGDDAKKSGGSSSWGGDDAKKSGGGSSWGGDDGSKSDGGGKWGGGVGGGGSSWGGDDGKKSGGGSSWGGDDGRKSGVGSKSFHSGSRGGDDGGKSDGGGSWGGGVGGGSSWSGGDGSKSGGSGSWGGGCSSLGGDDGKKSGSSSSWGGDDGRKSDGGSSWGGDDGRKSDGGSSWGGDDGRKSGSGNSWGGDGGSGGSGNNSGGGGGDDNSWGGGSGRSKGALNESNGGDGSRGLLGRGPGGSGLLGRGPGWSGEGSDDGKRAGSSAWGS